MLLINDRRAPVDLEPGSVPVLRWRDDDVMRAADPGHGGDPVAYRVVVDGVRADAAEGRGTVWDSGWIEGDAWNGVPLFVHGCDDMRQHETHPHSPVGSRDETDAVIPGVDGVPASRRYWVSMRWRYADGFESAWAEPATFGTGAGRNWHAEPIWGPESHDAQTDHLDNAAGWAFLRGTVTLPDKPIRWATLNATAASTRPARQFVYRMWINGRFVGVGPTFPIHGEARYDGYDVTHMLRAGRPNAIGVVAYTMDDRRFMAQLDVCYEDGSMDHFGTGAGGNARGDECGAEDGGTGGMTWCALADPAAVYPPSASIGTQYFEAPAENLRGDAYPQHMSDPDIDAEAAGECWLPVVVKPRFAELLATPTDKLAVRYVPPTSLLRVERPVKQGDAGDAAICGATCEDSGEVSRGADDGDGVASDSAAGAAGVADAGQSSAPAQILSVIADFGSARMGGIRLALNPREPIDLTIRYGEILNDDGSVKYQLSAGNVYEDHWHVVPGGKPLETWGLRVFRYVEISVAQPQAAPSSWDTPSPTGLDERAAAIEEILLSADGQAGIPALTAAALVYPSLDGTTDAPYPGAFRSSDPALNRVWQLSANTIANLNGNIYADSWTRERAAYEADAWIQQRAHLALDAAPSLGRYTIDYLIANRTWPTEWPLYLVLAVHESWIRTGSTAQIAGQYERLLGLLPDRYLDAATGLLIKEPGESSRTDGDLVDWPPSERDGFVFGEVNTVVNALASQVYADMAQMARAVGRDDDAVRCAGVAARMRAAIHERLYDADLGAYRDGLRVLGDARDAGSAGAAVGSADLADLAGRRFEPIDHAALHSSAFALAFADVPADRAERVVSFVRSRGMACSVYTAAPYLLGLYAVGSGVPGAAAEATAMIVDRRTTHSWAYMIAQNAGGTMEAWDVARKPNTTYSHPWAASPVFLLAEGLMGVRPLEPGYRRFAVAPQPGSVRAASVTVPTPAGDIRVAYRQIAGGSVDGMAGVLAADADAAGVSKNAAVSDDTGVGDCDVRSGVGAQGGCVIGLDVTVPSRTRADVILPTATFRDLGPGRHHLVG